MIVDLRTGSMQRRGDLQLCFCFVVAFCVKEGHHPCWYHVINRDPSLGSQARWITNENRGWKWRKR